MANNHPALAMCVVWPCASAIAVRAEESDVHHCALPHRTDRWAHSFSPLLAPDEFSVPIAGYPTHCIHYGKMFTY